MSDDLSTFEFENFHPEEWQRRVLESDAPLVFDSLALRLATRRHAREMCDAFDALLRASRDRETLFLVCGTAHERDAIARERGIDPRSIRLVQSAHDIFGRRGGRLIIGCTGSYGDFDEIVAYAKTHDIVVP